MAPEQTPKKGQEASCRGLSILFAEAGKKGHDAKDLASGLPFLKDSLLEAEARIDWESFSTILKGPHWCKDSGWISTDWVV